MSRLRRPSPTSPLRQSHIFPRGTLSKVAGAGSGTALIVAAEALNINATTRLLLQALAPWLAMGVAVVGPHVSAFLVTQVRYFGLMHLLNRAKRLEKSIPDDAPHKSAVQKNVREMETTMSDLITAVARQWSGNAARNMSDSTEPAREVRPDNQPRPPKAIIPEQDPDP
jgi:hypothetical protein